MMSKTPRDSLRQLRLSSIGAPVDIPQVSEGQARQVARSLRPDIRNPLLALAAMQELRAQPPHVRGLVRNLMLNIRADALPRAESCWRKHKGFQALYWRLVAVYTGHAARALR